MRPRFFCRSLHSADHLLDCSRLVLTKDDFESLIILVDECYVVAQNLEEALTIEKPLYLLFEVSRLLVLPIEEVAPIEAPSDAVVKADQVGDVEDLRCCQHLGVSRW